MHKILEGDLGRLDVPDVLSFLNMGRRTGVLALEKPDQETKLFFRDGQPRLRLFHRRKTCTSGAMLVRMRKVSADTSTARSTSRAPAAGAWAARCSRRRS
jgi:hypothetical protein